ncbi:MAG: DUF72 domain-containing protein [Pseudomonadota bacterium]
MHERYFLGLPAWAFPGWKDRYLSDTPSRLTSYARVFNAVEGNTTFYRIPDAGTVARWRDAVAGQPFRFCFKLPREVTHERRPNGNALRAFLTVIEPLSDHLGPLLVQFPATVAPADLRHFEPVFAAVRDLGRFVIEVRHPAFFEEPEQLESTLQRHGAGRVILDPRPIHQGDRRHPDVLAALHQKPDVPVFAETYNGVSLIRLILHPDVVSNGRYLDEWSRRVAGFLRRGITVYAMIHCPNYLHCPPFAADFHERLRREQGMSGLPELPHWPVPLQGDLLGG